MTELIVVLLGILCGTAAGMLPGIGITVTLVLMWPILYTFGILELILYYMALSATVQYTGTIPSVFFGVPGESNSVPASIEGPKFTRKNLAMLAIGGCQLSSIIGAIVGAALTLALLYFLIPHLQYFFNSTFKLALYSLVLVFLIFVYNQGRVFLNLFLIAIGFSLAMPGESMVENGLRYTFGFYDLSFGIPLLPVLIGFLVVPTILKNYEKDTSAKLTVNAIAIPSRKILVWLRRNIASVFRGSVIGYFCGFVPGMGTDLGTNSSYALEKKLHPLKPGKQLLSAESANNSGVLASWLPLLLIGIPITSSEVIIYGMLTNAGWNPLEITSVQDTMTNMFLTLSVWYVIINIIVLIVAWPFAKKVANIITCNYNTLIISTLVVLYFVNSYLGYLDFRFALYQICFFVFCTFGYFLRKHNSMPLIFMFIIALDFEAVLTRVWQIHF